MSFKNFTSVGIVTSFSLGLLSLARPTHALTIQLGEQDFSNGQGVDGMIEFNSASKGEDAPFDSFRGNDLVEGEGFSGNWTFNFAPGSYIGATLTLGIFDHDSQASGSQVSSFGFDGNDLTSLLDDQFESFGGHQLESNIYSIDIPQTFLADLNNGTATFSLNLQGPSLGGNKLDSNPFKLPGNGAGLDFARLELRSVPEAKLESRSGTEPKLDPTPGTEPKLDPTPGAEPGLDPTPGAEPKLDPTPGAEPKLDSTPGAEPGLDPISVPEPSTILGTVVALGFGTLLKRKRE